MTEQDHIRVIVREELNGKVMYTDTCKIKHEGLGTEMKDMKEKIKTLDGRFWSILIFAIAQLSGIVAILIKAH
jgi:hypothetical protein